MPRLMSRLSLLLCAVACVTGCAQIQRPAKAENSSAGDSAPATKEWNFVVSGDSRNCGDLIIPAIAAGSAQSHPAFYWHVGDLRAIYEVDEDYAGQLAANGKLRILDLKTYQNAAWD